MGRKEFKYLFNLHRSNMQASLVLSLNGTIVMNLNRIGLLLRDILKTGFEAIIFSFERRDFIEFNFDNDLILILGIH